MMERIATPRTIALTGDVAGSVSFDGSSDVSINAKGGIGFKNKIINGNFDIWQRGTSNVLAAPDTYLADRWLYGVAEGGSGTITVSRQAFTLGQTDVPGNPSYFARTQGSAWVSGVNGALTLSQKIENVSTFSGKTVTLSFWAKAGATRTLGIQLAQVFGTTGTFSPVVKINNNSVSLTTSWKKYTVSINIPSVLGKTITTNHCLFVGFYFTAKGSNAISGVTLDDFGSNVVDIAQVQLEEGLYATDFEQRHIQQELTLCQRYYEKSYSIAVAPGTINSSGSVSHIMDYTQNYAGFHVNYKVNKRVKPTVIFYNPVTGETGTCRNVNASANYPIISLTASNEVSHTAMVDNLAAEKSNVLQYNWTADAEL